MLKKSICLILTTMLISVFIITGAVASSKFSDVDDYWATDAINWAAEKGVVEGFPDGTFKPTARVKEAEFAAILARYVTNTDKAKISQRQEGLHWAQSIYDELSQWELPLLGCDNDKVKEKPISRGQVARVVAAKNGFNLDEKQAVYYMYENDLSSGMISDQMTFESYGVDKPLQRDQITLFIKLLNEKGYTTFMGKPSVKGDAGADEIVGIVDVPKDTTRITDEMFDELAKEKGIENLKEGQSRFPFANEVAEKYDLKVDGGDDGFGLKEKSTNNTLVAYTLHENGRSFHVVAYNYSKNKDIALDLIEATGKVKIDEVKENIRYHLEVNGMPEYRDITGGVTEVSGDGLPDSHLTIRIYLNE